MQTGTKRSAAVLAIAVLLAAGIAYVVFQRVRAPQAPPPSIVLGCEKSLLTTLVWVAESEGYFDQCGVQVSIREFGSGKASLAAMLEGEDLDMCTVAQTPVMFNSFKQDDFAIICAMVCSHTDMKVVSRRDKGVTDAASLVGKKVGITAGSTGQYFLYAVLLHSGVSMSSVETIDIAPPDLPQALEEGRVDAISTWEPHALRARERLGDRAVVLDTKNVYREDFYFVATRELLNTKPDAVVRFLRAMNLARRFLEEKEEEAKSILCHRLGLEPSQVDLLWDEFEFGLGLDQTILLTLEEEARWAIRSGLVDGDEIPNYLDYISADALEQVDAPAVRLIR
ncbi:MAG: ABC transporter substrate-binding protein [Lentisphaerae bacterium]|nr:ABC transporter substrate-binding protein [Lentisphaerota bacterium]